MKIYHFHIMEMIYPTKEMIDWFDNNSEFNQEENFFIDFKMN